MLVAAGAASAVAAAGEPIAPGLLCHAGEHGFMWWAYGWRGRSPDGHRVFCVQTARYGFSFDVDRASFLQLGLIDRAAAPDEAVAQSNDVIFRLPSVRLVTTVEVDGRAYRATSVAPKTDQVRIIEHGRYVQRVELLDVQLQDERGDPCPTVDARYELIAWPDRLAVQLHLTPREAGATVAARLSLEFADPAEWRCSRQDQAVLLGREAARESGLALLGRPGLAVDASTVRPAAEMPRTWIQPRRTLTVALIVLPFGPGDRVPAPERIRQELAPHDDVVASARGIAPYAHPLESRFEPLDGCYVVRLGDPAPDGWSPSLAPDRLERVSLMLRNPDDAPRVVRLTFARESRSEQGITGLTPVLRDAEGWPVGLPVQISKNWHETMAWFRGSTMLTLPPRSSTPLELTIVYAFWGGVPAVSHAQLCLVGWGVNQLWHEVAIGSFGESITYDPDVNLNRGMIDDMRPLLCRPMAGLPRDAWGWTNNVGGGDFLVLVDREGRRRHLARVRSLYSRYGPNLSEVTYAGQTPDGAIGARITVSHCRSDDLVRGIYRVRYDVRRAVPFERLAFFQLGADHYNDHQFARIAHGEAERLIEEWTPSVEGAGYEREGIVCTGRLPWFSLHEAVPDVRQSGAWANRGLVIRRWEARLGGRGIAAPSAATFRTKDRVPSVALELTPPPDLKELSPGDYVEADLELLVLPMSADDYLGPNQALRRALDADGNSWRMVRREAVGNDLQVVAEKGRVVCAWPVRIACDAVGEATWRISGGLGFIPVTLTGVRGYRGWRLEQRTGDGWKGVDQSVHGRDFWQAEFQPATGTWDLTLNLAADRPDPGVPLELRCLGAGESAPTTAPGGDGSP